MPQVTAGDLGNGGAPLSLPVKGRDNDSQVIPGHPAFARNLLEHCLRDGCTSALGVVLMPVQEIHHLLVLELVPETI